MKQRNQDQLCDTGLLLYLTISLSRALLMHQYRNTELMFLPAVANRGSECHEPKTTISHISIKRLIPRPLKSIDVFPLNSVGFESEPKKANTLLLRIMRFAFVVLFNMRWNEQISAEENMHFHVAFFPSFPFPPQHFLRQFALR